MAHEFIAKKGLISQGNAQVSGSLLLADKITMADTMPFIQTSSITIVSKQGAITITSEGNPAETSIENGSMAAEGGFIVYNSVGSGSGFIDTYASPNRAATFNSFGGIQSSPTTDVELSYLSGSTGNIQSQLDNLVPSSASFSLTSSYLLNYAPTVSASWASQSLSSSYMLGNEIDVPPVTIGDVSTSDSTLHFLYGLSDGNVSYGDYGYSFQYDVYAFKWVNGAQIFSTTPLVFSGNDDSQGNKLYQLSASWDATTGADGYRVVVTLDSFYGYPNCGTAYFYTTNTYLRNGSITDYN
jgi:hypothetical protein